MARKRQAGFSLVELMIVVAIIGLLAQLAIGGFDRFKIRARQAEMRNNLNAIATLQASYFGDVEKYFGDGRYISGSPPNCNVQNALGFRMEGCERARYLYHVRTPPANGWAAYAVEVYDPATGDRRVGTCKTASVPVLLNAADPEAVIYYYSRDVWFMQLNQPAPVPISIALGKGDTVTWLGRKLGSIYSCY